MLCLRSSPIEGIKDREGETTTTAVTSISLATHPMQTIVFETTVLEKIARLQSLSVRGTPVAIFPLECDHGSRGEDLACRNPAILQEC